MESGRLFFGSTSSSNMFFLGNGDNYFRGTRVGEEFSKKRPFFSSLDDMLEEEEYYDEQLTEKKRRLSTEQVRMLERSFEEENKLEPERKTELAKKLGLQPRQVAVWFQNRRARWKTKTLERDYDRLKSSFDILTSDFDSIVKENEKLKAEVLSLTGKLQSKEVLETSTVGGSAAVEAEYVLAPPRPVKVEDRFSTGSGGSAVVDDQDGPQLVDSGDSYFPDDDYPHEYAAAPVDQSEEDDGSDNGHNDFPYPFATTDHQHHEEADVLGWWVWPQS